MRVGLHVPVELRRDGLSRWFRLANAVGVDGLSLAHAVPDELDGPLAIAFHLPGDREPIRCRGRAAETIVGEGEDEHAERSAITFFDIEESAHSRIANYVTERLGL